MGVVVFEFVSVQFNTFVLLMVLVLLFVFVLLAPKKLHAHFKKTMYMGVALQTFFFVLGYANAQYHHRPVPVVDLEMADGVICTITQTPVTKTRSYKSEALIKTARINDEWIQVDKKMVVYCPLDSSPPFAYGDIVYIQSKIAEPRLPANPYQFNYKNYLHKKDIFYQTYVKDAEVWVLGKKDGYTLADFEEHAVQYTRRVFYTLIPDSGLSAIATALLVGFQEELDPDTKTSFSRVGAMHILAVSGLHVGIIFILLSNILFPLDRNRYTKILKAFILIVFLWGYAIIAGFSPSIVRASLMFTLLIPILSFKMQGNAYNNIASSAFLLLLYNPDYLFDVGFQLSYIAVFGIIYLYPALKNWVHSKYWLINQVWQLTAVSLAATIFTCPVVLYNFGQFPLSFFISNLIAVPVSTLIIYLGLLALVVYQFNFISIIIGKILFALLWFLKWSVEWVEALPYSYLDHLLINRWQVFVLYAIIFSIILYFQDRKITYLKAGLIALCIFTTTLIYRKYQVMHHQELYIYNLNKTWYVEYINGPYAVNVLDKPLTEMDDGLFIRTNHLHAGIFYKVKKHAEVAVFLPAFQVRNTRFFIIDKWMPVTNEILETDYLILSNLQFLDVDMLKKQFAFKKVIVLNNHSVKKQAKLEELLAQAQIPYYSLAREGCFRLEF